MAIALIRKRIASSVVAQYLRNHVRALTLVLASFSIILIFRYTAATSLPSSRLPNTLPIWLGGIGDSYYSKGPAKYYRHRTIPFFPPLRTGEADSLSASELCRGFPNHLLETVQIVIKTGVADSAHNKAHLATLSSCIKNLIVLSDVDEQIGEHHLVDVLADLPPSYHDNNPDFEAYEAQKAEYAKGGSVGKSKTGWKLDRFKFLPMVDRTYKTRPDAQWYVFLEADVYLFWDTLFRLLEQLDYTKPHYIGSPVAGGYGLHFAYGGSSFVMSQGLMTQLLGDGTSLSTKYEQLAKDDCCGDAVLAYAIYDKTGVRVEGLFPTFAGDELAVARTDAERWCVPFLSIHRVSPEQMEALWRWERTRPYDETPMYYSKLFAHTLSGLTDADVWEDWDNLSDHEQWSWSGSHASAEACKVACAGHKRCLQYSYSGKKCRFGYFVQQGRPAKKDRPGTVSGWNIEAMERLGLNLKNMVDTGCKDATWVRPVIK